MPLIQTKQTNVWTGDFGREYTDRNPHTIEELNERYRSAYGISRSEINERFLNGIPRSARVLEVGCNIGTQILLLKSMGFTDLSGIEIQSYALAQARERLPEAELVQASALSIPFPDRTFDLVFTSGVLIHIAPSDLSKALGEIYRCTEKWIWGFEYYAPELIEIAYRGHEKLLWKTDYSELYQKWHDVELIREERFKYLHDNNVDASFLLCRRG